MPTPAAKAKKDEGNVFYKNKEYEKAIEKYTEAINLDGSDVTFFSNRSACYAALNKWQEAAEDGKQCIMVDKNFVKGYFRQALALQNMGLVEAAIDATKRGLGIDSASPDLKKMQRELEETLRMKKVDASIATAESQLKAGDINDAFKTVDQAQRLDPTNTKLKSLMDTIRPKYERLEKERISSLNPSEVIKEDGDKKFKNAEFEAALKSYTKCLDSITDKSSELALKCYANRAACYKQLSNFDGTIEDCTNVLEHKPDDVKALVRRAQALEAVERYKSAMQDVRQVLAYGPEACGKASYDLANGMQHRLTRLIQQLKMG